MSESFWMKRNTKTTNYPTLQKETDVHIAIIGGGLTGISTAYYLAQAEEDAILLEADQLCFGASGRNTEAYHAAWADLCGFDRAL